MKSPLSYLILMRMKNRIRSIVRSPGKLLYLIFLLALMGLVIFGARHDTVEVSRLRDIRELYAAALALYLFLFLLIAKNGFGEGASLFSLSDVNLVFPAPIPAHRVLFFGLVQQLGTSLLLGFFLLFQYAWMHQSYGIGFGDLLLILLGYALTLFMAQLTAMTIYTFTSADERLRSRVKAVCVAALALPGAALLWFVWSGLDQIVPRLVEAGNSLPLRLFPVAGWTAGIAAGLIAGEPAGVIRGCLLCAGYIVGLILLITLSRQDYYEDVLKASETAHSAAEAKREGRIGATRRKVRVGRKGLDRGAGANAFYYKHKLENRRERLFLLSGSQLLFAGVVLGFTVFVRTMGIIPVFLFATYMQVFSVAMGRLTKELMKHYVYLVPEPPMRKLLHCIREGFSGFVLEAVLLFVPIGLLLGLGIPETLCCILARVSFSVLFLAGNILVSRLFGMMTSKMFTLLFYILTMIVLVLPGGISALLLVQAGFVLVNPIVTAFLAMTACNLAVALLTLCLCRDMLLYTELNNG